MDLAEVEGIKKRRQEYTEEPCKKTQKNKKQRSWHLVPSLHGK